MADHRQDLIFQLCLVLLHCTRLQLLGSIFFQPSVGEFLRCDLSAVHGDSVFDICFELPGKVLHGLLPLFGGEAGIWSVSGGLNQILAIDVPMDTLRRYVEKWEDMQRENIGLLLYGDVGTGKSFGAACIANSLIEQSISACMINLSTVLNSMGGFQSEEKNTYISDLMRYPLLILDDFGMERQTEYALEQVFNVIDARYRSGKPLIITTNLSMAELNNPKSLEHKRIYDRIKEMCQPLNFGSNGRRHDRAQEKRRVAAELLSAE